MEWGAELGAHPTMLEEVEEVAEEVDMEGASSKEAGGREQEEDVRKNEETKCL